jgi:histidine triad (HIT) family protein
MSDCLFCKIIERKLPGNIVHDDAEVVAFEDINPGAPMHVLVVPRAHIRTVNDLQPEHDALIGKLYRVAAQLARARGVADRGYRLVMNCNREAGQSVWHLHLHALGGRPLHWPPG